LLILIAVKTVSIMHYGLLLHAQDPGGQTIGQATDTLYRIVVTSALSSSIRLSGAIYSIATTFLYVRGSLLTALIKKVKRTALVNGEPPSHCQTRNVPIICDRVRAVVIGALKSTCSELSGEWVEQHYCFAASRHSPWGVLLG
jgi:hypothetical protein